GSSTIVTTQYQVSSKVALNRWQTRATSGEEVPRMPAVILDRKPTRRGNTSIIKLLIHWIGSSHADASCEWLDMVMDHFPEFVG
ncbi:hypothetical protein Tsubulata_034291, partial [Turnera subulata]